MQAWRSLTTLLFFIVVLPASLTYLHLRYVLQRANLLMVEPASNQFGLKNLDSDTTRTSTVAAYNDMFCGVYQHLPLFPNFYLRIRKHADDVLLTWGRNWPSIVGSATLLTTHMSHILSAGDNSASSSILFFDAKEDRSWCFATRDNVKVCSESQNSLKPPATGKWTAEGGVNADLYISSVGIKPDPSKQRELTITTLFNNLRNGTEPPRYKQTMDQVLQRPATTLLLALNAYLALIYMASRVSSATVAKTAGAILDDGELWRAYSGATAHFTPLHFVFNMMSLYTLGRDLEGAYGSIPFLLYNISLIAFTTALWLVLRYLKNQLSGTNDDKPTIGYSGVLFAWMVIASLERESICPFPFLPDMCFATFKVWKFRLNANPLVQLILMQVIVPNASFEGHLSGMIAGFLLHWNFLPLEYVQPSVLIPALWMLYQWRIRRAIPVIFRDKPRLDLETNEDLHLKSSFLAARQQRYRSDRNRDDGITKSRDLVAQQLMVHNQYGLVAVFAVNSFLLFDILSGLVLAPLLGLACFSFCVDRHALLLADSDDFAERTRHKDQLASLLKGFVVSSILTIIMEAMAIPPWIITNHLWEGSGWVRVGLSSACLLLLTQVIVQVCALSLALERLYDMEDVNSGVFKHVFGFCVLENGRVVGNRLACAAEKHNVCQLVSLDSKRSSSETSINV